MNPPKPTAILFPATWISTPKCNIALQKGDPALILYGTVSGNAELLAHKLATTLRQADVTVQVRDMVHCRPSILTEAHCVLIVVSTYGDGEPPEDAAPFCHAVVNDNGLDLRAVKFSVLALDNTNFRA